MDKIKIKNPLIFLLIFPIKIYQFLISPLIGQNCRFVPTCSEYCLESIKEYGLLKGIYLTLLRLKKCHPLGESGYDPVKKEIMFKKVDLKDILKFRRRFLYKSLPKELSKYKEDYFNNTKHYGLYIDKKLISGLTIIRREDKNGVRQPAVQIRGMFTIDEKCGVGNGTNLIENLVMTLKKEGVKYVWCNSRIKAIGFYEKNNFKRASKVFDIKSIGKHIRLERRI